ncbi:MAG TPA: glycosyltransferase family 2 protein [Rhodopila sp.]|uniref:glycosyltransferase family 2 protein n=1 Tax=Rhodopila sp. TaxID=2480087 RepID=UPI002B86A6FF|nr:glycosyltransferase family 2 protein [Rhodopila sp.]HVY17898.1 glycosyltransferase family 2 protein [Rhodopila sp.]
MTPPPSGRLLAGEPPPIQPVAADIIILALDRADETIAAILSARAQTGVDTHVYVLDQGSTPENLDRLVTAIGPHCSLFVTDANLGVAGGRNFLSRVGTGRTIVALDNDAEFATTDTVARLVAALDAEPALAAIGCRIVSDRTGRDDLSSWGYPRGLLPAAGESFDAVTFVGAGHAIRRSAWLNAGGYDDALFFCWEEFDFALRAIAQGWRIRYRGDIVIRHKVAGEHRVTWSGRRWFYFVRNRLYIERKHARSAWPRAAGYLVKGTINGRPIATLRAIMAAWRMPAEPADRALGAQALGAQALAYLRRNDQAHRGGLVRRLMREVFAAIGQPSGAAATAGR